jgi:protein phosphatase methylesterase 1
VYVWKNDLMKSEPYWTEWFKGLSSTFIKSKHSKLLLLAERERLDKELVVA